MLASNDKSGYTSLDRDTIRDRTRYVWQRNVQLDETFSQRDNTLVALVNETVGLAGTISWNGATVARCRGDEQEDFSESGSERRWY